MGLIVALLACLPWLAGLSGGWVWDDHSQLQYNVRLALDGIGGFWTQGEHRWSGVGRVSRYNPVGWTLLALQGSLTTPASPVVFRTVSLVVHGINAALIALLLRRIVPGRASLVPAVLAALLFAWHPAQAEVVQWPSAQFDAWALLFVLCGAGLILRGTRRGAVTGASLACAAVLCKESFAPLALGLPLGLALIQGSGAVRWKEGAGASLAGLLAVRGLRAVVGIGSPEAVGDGSLASVALAFAELVRMTLAPAERSLMRPLPTSIGVAEGVTCVVLLGAVVVGLRGRARIEGRLVVGGVALIGGGLALGAVAGAAFELLPDRYVYTGSPGLSALLFGSLLSAREQVRRVGALAAGVVLLLFGAADLSQSARWQDDVAFFAWEVEVWPDAPQTNFYLGHSLAESGLPTEAIPWLVRAVEAGPTLPQTWGRLAAVRLQSGDREGALRDVAQGLTHVPGDPGLLELRAQLVE